MGEVQGEEGKVDSIKPQASHLLMVRALFLCTAVSCYLQRQDTDNDLMAATQKKPSLQIRRMRASLSLLFVQLAEIPAISV